MKDCTKTTGWKAGRQRGKETQKKTFELNKALYEKFPKLCYGCKTELQYTKRFNKFCTQSCAASLNNAKFPKRSKQNSSIIKKHVVRNATMYTMQYSIMCTGCNTIFLTSASTRTYCSDKCKSTSIKLSNFQKFYDGQLVLHRIARNALIEKFGAKCQLCNWNIPNIVTKKCPIELDHIDGNAQNTVISNTRLLCPNCHSIQPTYKALNKGNGRYSRLQRYKQGKSY